MDSLTQIVLGAAVGEAVAGRKLGAKAALWGAIGGTLPDLDVFLRFLKNGPQEDARRTVRIQLSQSYVADERNELRL